MTRINMYYTASHVARRARGENFVRLENLVRQPELCAMFRAIQS
jgi:hypothetical protein